MRNFKKIQLVSALYFFTLSPLFLTHCPASDFTFTTPGARANGLGTAFSSIADDPYAIFYNPAGLVQLRTVQLYSGMGRRLSKYGNAGDFSVAYSRPLPDKQYSVFGFGLDSFRQAAVGDRDIFLFGYSDVFTFKYFQMPVMWGSNFRITSLRYKNKSHLGLGGDAGVILRSYEGLRTGLVLSDLDTGMGRSLTTLTIGNSWRHEDTTFAMDFKIRGGYSEFFPGVEHSFYNDLFRARLGKGINFEGDNYLVMGFGMYLDPLVINLAYSLPWEGLNKKAGLYEMTFCYKFEAPKLGQKLVVAASEKLSELNTRIDELNKQKGDLETQIASYQAGKGVLESDLTLMQSRMRELQTRVKELEIQAIDAQFKKQNPPRKKKVEIKKPEKWPKFHKVQNGDTLRSVASKYYGDENLWQLIYDANQDKIARGLPKEGELLLVPAPVK